MGAGMARSEGMTEVAWLNHATVALPVAGVLVLSLRRPGR
jgi:hypothetical protein